MEKTRKRLTNREWWAKYGPRFEETDRKLLERIAYYERRSPSATLAQPEPKRTPPEVDLVQPGR